MYIPFHVKLASIAFPISKYEDGTNESRGEIVRMNFKDADRYEFGKQVVGCSDGYSWIWRHLGLNYWKVTSKVKEGPWSCQ